MAKQKINPCLWFDKECEDAMNFYVTLFSNRPGTSKGESKIVSINRYPEGVEEGAMKGMGGKVLTAFFELDGQIFQALDGGPMFKFNEAISFSVECDDQEEVDYFWNKLSAVPESEQCGWLKDKFGLSWQIIPKQMGEMLMDSDQEKVGRALQAMLQMKKIDVAKLKEAFDGK
jgi:predicted 3-demethylubiquinone-9 3-methyltransferase (glyoxalase superfamily)